MFKRQCLCAFSKDDILEKFHHFLHNIIAISILVMKDLPNDLNLIKSDKNSEEIISARYWSLAHKEKLFLALIKIFSINMPLYLAYKHLLIGHDRYSRSKECSCSKLSTDSISLIQSFCQPKTKNNNNIVKK